MRDKYQRTAHAILVLARTRGRKALREGFRDPLYSLVSPFRTAELDGTIGDRPRWEAREVKLWVLESARDNTPLTPFEMNEVQKRSGRALEQLMRAVECARSSRVNLKKWEVICR